VLVLSMLVALRYNFCRKEGNLQLSDVLFIDDIEIDDFNVCIK
jgi:hypothetical protein